MENVENKTTNLPAAQSQTPQGLNILLTWDAVEFEEHEKGPGWYLTFVIIALLFVIYELFIKDYFGAITLAIIAGVAYFFSRLKPKNVVVKITDKGVLLNDFFVPYSNITHFWFVNHAHSPILHIETSAIINQYVVVHLYEQTPEQVRAVLSPYVPEAEIDQEPLTHRIARFFRF